jgi:hypothetical protein
MWKKVKRQKVKAKSKVKRKLFQAKIDNLVVAQTNDDSAWDKPVRVHRRKSASLAIPAELVARATFLARLHRQRNIEKWLTQIIQERVELEEAAFAGAKRELAKSHG